ncbi:MAG: class I adenylate-forming enzyme family protein [Candidatus Acidiferrales bacterium]
MSTGVSAIFCAPGFAAYQDAIVTPNRALSWGRLREQVSAECGNQGELAKQRVGLLFQSKVASYVGLLALGQIGVDLFLMDGRLSSAEALDLGREFNLSAVLSPGEDGNHLRRQTLESYDAREWSGTSTVTILTSGSTGRPKAVRHTWTSLCRPVRSKSSTMAPRWLQTYRPNLYAGMQVLLQCLLGHGALLLPPEGGPPSSIIEFAAENGVEYISATPSYWRRLLISCDSQLLARMHLRQITLGGEVVDQSILDTLKQHFPGVRLTHIYATTELGRCFAVIDGQAGFPATFLGGPSEDGIELNIVDGELFAKSGNAMQCYDGGDSPIRADSPWFATGDVVEVVGRRVRFVGRKSEMINVGGNKVYPVEVESVIRNVPGVCDVRVYGRSSSISGQLVACEIVPESGRDATGLKNEVRQACNASLEAYQLPRLIEFVQQIELSAAQKTVRSGR